MDAREAYINATAAWRSAYWNEVERIAADVVAKVPFVEGDEDNYYDDSLRSEYVADLLTEHAWVVQDDSAHAVLAVTNHADAYHLNTGGAPFDGPDHRDPGYSAVLAAAAMLCDIEDAVLRIGGIK